MDMADVEKLSHQGLTEAMIQDVRSAESYSSGSNLLQRGWLKSKHFSCDCLITCDEIKGGCIFLSPPVSLGYARDEHSFIRRFICFIFVFRVFMSNYQ